MPVCDICNVPLSDESMIVVGASKIISATDKGFVPDKMGGSELLELFGKSSQSDKHAQWHYSVQRAGTADWGLCAACLNDIEAFSFENSESESFTDNSIEKDPDIVQFIAILKKLNKTISKKLFFRKRSIQTEISKANDEYQNDFSIFKSEAFFSKLLTSNPCMLTLHLSPLKNALIKYLWGEDKTVLLEKTCNEIIDHIAGKNVAKDSDLDIPNLDEFVMESITFLDHEGNELTTTVNINDERIQMKAAHTRLQDEEYTLLDLYQAWEENDIPVTSLLANRLGYSIHVITGNQDALNFLGEFHLSPVEKKVVKFYNLSTEYQLSLWYKDDYSQSAAKSTLEQFARSIRLGK